MTLKEVAARAGVSVSTVSRIINSPDDSFARKEVRERVWAIIKETGYTPNLNARELKQGKSKARNTSVFWAAPERWMTIPSLHSFHGWLNSRPWSGNILYGFLIQFLMSKMPPLWKKLRPSMWMELLSWAVLMNIPWIFCSSITKTSSM